MDGTDQTLNASGTITATVTSAPNAVLPASVIVEEVCAVSWSGGSGAMGGCANPLGGTTTALQPAGGSCTYIKYTSVSSPNPSYSCAPLANVSIPNGVGGAISVEYRVVYPVGVTLGGTTTYNGAQVALTGQALSGTLAFGTGFTGKTLTNSWAKPGGGFEDYKPSLTSNQLVPLSAADLAKSTLSFYDGTAEALTLTDSATVGPPPGVQGSTTPVSASSTSFTVEKPTVVWHINDNPSVYSGFLPPNTQGFGAQEVWDPITITVKLPFSGGNGCIAQIAMFNRQATRSPQNGQPATYTLKIAQTNPDGTTSYVAPGAVLDGGFPYPIGYPDDGTGKAGATPVQNGYQWSVGVPGHSSDTPQQAFTPPLVGGDTGGTDWYKTTASDSFTTWLMYQPPSNGSNVVWVPLQSLGWSWNGTGTNSNGVWSANGALNSPGSATDTNTPPQWNMTLPYGQFTLRP